ncbi:MAG: tRNA pseudouridine(38-40) synthase TruA [Chitinophagaceae bacterium]
MPRYFLEVSYKGTAYSGFQKQDNANTIQAEIEKAFSVLQKNNIEITGSSRTDAGVHALQNFFHFDYDNSIQPQFLYKLNAILPIDIVAVNIQQVGDDAHCRFDATSRAYRYFIHQAKNPFLYDRAYYYPYTIDFEKLNEAAKLIMQYVNFTSFSKRNTQVKSFECRIEQSEWKIEEKLWIYHVKANRFLRGMVRGLTGTMLQVGRDKISIENLKTIIEGMDNSKAYFAVPAKGLFLEKVEYPDHIYKR